MLFLATTCNSVVVTTFFFQKNHAFSIYAVLFETETRFHQIDAIRMLRIIKKLKTKVHFSLVNLERAFSINVLPRVTKKNKKKNRSR